MTQTSNREHAIVIGGSIGGLFAARALSDLFTQVTIIERDPVNDQPESRKGQPQTRHLHGILIPAQKFIDNNLPDVREKLLDGGALENDWGKVTRWHHFGGYSYECELGVRGIALSRTFMEYEVRKAVTSIENIQLMAETSVDSLVMNDTNTSVSGVHVTYRAKDHTQETILADLVVDVSGRGSPMPKWLNSMGYTAPEEQHVKINVGYATRTYTRTGKYLDEPKIFMIQATPPHQTRTTFMFPIEGDRWIVTASGYLGDYPSADANEFLEFVQSIPTDDIYNIISKEQPLTNVVTHRFPSSRRRRYEKLDHFPNNLLVIGDAVASFNPIYGQGMSSVALQVNVMKDMLEQHDNIISWKSFFQRTSKIIDWPWQVAAGEDFRYPQAEGEMPPAMNLINAYIAKVHRATHHDPVVFKQFAEVLNLIAHPMSLMKPNILWRVLLANTTKSTEINYMPVQKTTL